MQNKKLPQGSRKQEKREKLTEAELLAEAMKKLKKRRSLEGLSPEGRTSEK